MKSSPILFSTEMVQAILDGRKTQTRRLVKMPVYHPSMKEKDVSKMVIKDNILYDGNGENIGTMKPPRNIGDIMWVKETFQDLACFDSQLTGWAYRADDGMAEHAKEYKINWRPSLFMPYDACRIFLEITNIRVEKLQSINNKDAQAEGASDTLTLKDFAMLKGMDWVIPRPFLEYQFGFLALWSRINGVKSWLDNPYVWVIEFKIKEVKK